MPSRRSLLQSSAATAGILILKPQTVFGSQANSTPELGLIGCGSRGGWISPLFVEHTGARFTALADALPDNLAKIEAKLKVDHSRCFLGFDAYKQVIQSKVDGVVIMIPPYYHPDIVAAAVAAGKHVYIAKPVAVDVPGCLSIEASGQKARGRLSFLVDFQWRVRAVYKESIERVRRGDIGTPVLAQTYYMSKPPGRRERPGMSPGEARLRNWYLDRPLAGDLMIDRDIHVIDAMNWYIGARPLKANGTGGHKARPVGDCWDHFVVTYSYPNGVTAVFSSADFINGYADMCVRLYGSAGTVDSHYNGALNITGDHPWKGAEKDDTFTGGAIENLKAWVASIRTGQYLNNVPVSVESNLTAILGRTAAWAGHPVTWDQMLAHPEKLEAHLTL